MIENAKFRNALNGYNKEDVNRYIKEADIDYTAALETLQMDISAKEETIRTLEIKLSEALEQAEKSKEACDVVHAEKAEAERILAETKDSLSTATTVKEQTERSLAKLQQTHTDMETTLAARTKELEAKTRELDDKTREMKEAVAAEKAKAEEEMARFREELVREKDSIAYKSQMYDRLSGQIGDILLGANRDADDIMVAAKEDADKLRTDTMEEMANSKFMLQEEIARLRNETEAEAAQLKEHLTETSARLLSDISDEIRGSSDSCLKELATCLTEMAYETQTLIQTLNTKYSEVQDRLQYYQTAAQDNIDRKIKAIGIPENGIPGSEA